MTSCLTSAAVSNRGVVGKMKGEKKYLSPFHCQVTVYVYYGISVQIGH